MIVKRINCNASKLEKCSQMQSQHLNFTFFLGGMSQTLEGACYDSYSVLHTLAIYSAAIAYSYI